MTLFDPHPESLNFYIPGKPIPQGSKRWLPGGKMIEANSSLRPWRSVVTSYTLQAMRATRDRTYPVIGPVTVVMDFSFARPKSHYGTGKNAGKVKDSAPLYNTNTPDLDKLIRAVQDGMTDAGLWQDDSQVVTLHCTKVWAEQPGVVVTVYPL